MLGSYRSCYLCCPRSHWPEPPISRSLFLSPCLPFTLPQKDSKRLILLLVLLKLQHWWLLPLGIWPAAEMFALLSHSCFSPVSLNQKYPPKRPCYSLTPVSVLQLGIIHLLFSHVSPSHVSCKISNLFPSLQIWSPNICPFLWHGMVRVAARQRLSAIRAQYFQFSHFVWDNFISWLNQLGNHNCHPCLPLFMPFINYFMPLV